MANDLALTLEPILKREIAGFEELVSAERLSGGASQETYRLGTLISGKERTLALRRAAGGATETVDGRPGLAIEAKLMQIVGAAGVPEPEIILVLDPDAGVGPGFVMDWVDGETLGARIVRSPDLAPVRPQLAFQVGQILARIHQIDPGANQLDDHLVVLDTEDFVEQTWLRYRELATPQPMIDYTAVWLMANLPPSTKPALVHNDFRNGNLIVGPDGVRAVLDWETAHLGDPMRDLGWICTNSWRFGQRQLPVGGFGHYADLFAGYESVSGVKVDRDRVRFWEVFGSFWWAVGCLSMGEHYRNGPDPSVERPAIARRSSECQIDCVNLLIPGPVELVEGSEPPLDGSSTDLPRSDELLESVADFLRDSVMADTRGRTQFLSRVAANSLDIVRREFRLGPAHRQNEQDRLQALLAPNNDGDGDLDLETLRWHLVDGLRQGSIGLEHRGLASHLRQTAANQVAIDQPNYSGLQAALENSDGQ